VAVATQGFKGLSDEVSDHFACAKTFTIIAVEGKKSQVKVVSNPVALYARGRGREVVQMLSNEGVNVAVAGEFGSGAMTFLQRNKIDAIVEKAGTRVVNVLRSKILKYDAA
jgi:predicted Fe-Mo cluster-binding NifX family protein